ncbi:ADP-ribosylation [Glarea lozoyensis ATCC 20868]|uniref:2'-phosphotransferase n=1 Tax=Glarea lozoyensis (strain ATCC 20868 / MF5171) TaxID=1116229 RepID=S3CZW8_GLAL2|nr:ADP-ribosylation [Glarea lozoyensis ATCC 20868]EPE31792.1 ADP-ribosylation [Glarea lozoyensis ATCC 20868]
MASSKSPEQGLDADRGVEVEERIHGRGDRRGGARGARGGKGGRPMNREVEVSKALSKLLRHAAEEQGIKLDDEGYASLEQVMSWSRLKSLNVSFSDILTAVNDNAKSRFSMKPNPKSPQPVQPDSTNPSDWVIRANQGHSIAIESASLLKPITLEAGNIPDVVVHGTYFAFYQAIVDTGGLKKMTRTHIHFGTALPGDKGVVSGMRNDAELLIYVDVRKALEEGVLWWISENGVVLTEGDGEGVLSSRFFKRVVGRREEECPVLWVDGERVGELPEKLRGRKPPFGGKGRGGGGRGGRGKGRGGRGRGGDRGEGAGVVASTGAEVTGGEP